MSASGLLFAELDIIFWHMSRLSPLHSDLDCDVDNWCKIPSLKELTKDFSESLSTVIILFLGLLAGMWVTILVSERFASHKDAIVRLTRRIMADIQDASSQPLHCQLSAMDHNSM